MLNLDDMCLKIKARSHFFSLGFAFCLDTPHICDCYCCKWGWGLIFTSYLPTHQRVFGFYNYLPHFRGFLENPWLLILSLDEMCSVIEAWSQVLFCFVLLCVRMPPHINGIRDWLLLTTHQHKMRRVFGFYNHLPHFRGFLENPWCFMLGFDENVFCDRSTISGFVGFCCVFGCFTYHVSMPLTLYWWRQIFDFEWVLVFHSLCIQR